MALGFRRWVRIAALSALDADAQEHPPSAVQPYLGQTPPGLVLGDLLDHLLEELAVAG